MASTRPVRILHVVYRMDRGGTETWLMNVLRRIDRSAFQMDFLVDTEKPCAYDDEIRELGSRIIPCARASRPWKHYHDLQRTWKKFGPYDIVHCHVAHAGLELAWFKRLGVPVRIAHSHNDRQQFEPSNLLRRLILHKTTKWLTKVATHGLAASEAASDAMFGDNWRDREECQILHYGVDLSAFCSTGSDDRRCSLRDDLRIPREASVVGHVGRFAEQKNHRFLVEIAAEVLKKIPDTRFVLVGVGPLEVAIRKEVARRGLTDRFVFAGIRDNVPMLMRDVFDLFLFPSLFEGLGIVLLEAQAAGTPCVLSNSVPSEADVVAPLMQRISLSAPVKIWSNAVVRSLRELPPNISREQALTYMSESDFDIEKSVAKLVAFYEQCLGEGIEKPGLSAQTEAS